MNVVDEKCVAINWFLLFRKVFDYDWGLQDDFMGSAKLDLRTIELNRPQELVIKLEDQSRPFRSLGELKINITLWPKTQEDKEQVECILRIKNRMLLHIMFKHKKSLKKKPKTNFHLTCTFFSLLLSHTRDHPNHVDRR